jgi:putative ABC transport system permease protein
MLPNHLRTTLRYLWSHKFFSGINLLSLSIGLCVCFLAGLYVQFELSYDTYHEHADRIYRLVTDVETATGVNHESTSAPMAPALQSAFAEVENATRVLLDYLIVQPEDRSFFGEETVAYADPSLFSVFTFPLISGNAATALEAPLTLVLSESAAQRFFGTTDCLGETLLLDNSSATVTGVMRDMPQNAHFRVDILVSMATLLKAWNPAMNEQWSRFGFYTYLLLPEHTDAAQLSTKFSQHIRPHLAPDERYSLSLEPLIELYLTGKARGSRTGSSKHGNIRNVYIFSVVAIFVLFIACFNFVNLTTALSLQRTKEVGVRKVLGASRRQLIGQFLLDAVLLSLLASVLALLLSALLLPWFNQLAGSVARTNLLSHLPDIGWLLLVALLAGVVSGLYPAWLLSGFGVAGNFGRLTGSKPNGQVLSRALIIAQFSVSIILMVATAVVYRQLQYMQTSDPGFAKEHKLVVDFHFDQAVWSRSQLLKQQLTNVPGVSAVSLSSSVPGRANRKFATLLEDQHQAFQEMLMDVYFVDDDFLEQYDIKLIAGRGFSADQASDSTEAMLLNEAAVRQLGFSDPEALLGKRFEQKGRQGTIIGVVEDFHVHSFREVIPPMTLRVNPGWNLYTFVTLSVSPQDVPATISALKSRWKEIVPGKPFAYFFLDENYNRQYATEARFSQLFLSLATVAFVLSCLGLIALSTLSAVRRTKEVGIRKVLGASVPSVVRLLTKDFLGLVLIAVVVSLPTAWWLADQWLQTFAYRVSVSGWLLLGVGLVAIIVAAIAVGFQAVRAAVVNPVDSLRAE